MSYRAVKRVLGESNLELKCLVLFGLSLLLLIGGSFLWNAWRTKDFVYEQNRRQTQMLVDPILIHTHWENLERDQQFKQTVPWLNRDLQRQDYEWSFLRPGAVDSRGEAEDPQERQWLEELLRAPPPPEGTADDEPQREFRERFVAGKEEYQYYEPIRALDSCLVVCHRPPPQAAEQAGTLTLSSTGLNPGQAVREGDVLSVVKIRVPYGPTKREVTANSAILLAAAIVTAFLTIVASYLIVRYVIVKPLRHLRDVSDSISKGNLDIRAEIHTADEFEELAVAFNRMVWHLIAAQQELRQANTNLDGKIDELAQVNMQLYEMNRLKSDFLATMSHELRTPLNSIIGFSEVLGSIPTLDDKQKRYVGNIQKSGRMLLDMINDILDLAKLESGKMQVRVSEFRIEQVVAAQCDMARPLTERKNIDLEMDIQSRLPSLRQDQAKVQQILNNLLSNAIKFTPEGGRIIVAAKAGPLGQLQLIVADTGVGIAPEDQAAIFEKFRQGKAAVPAGDAMTREYSGTGLGLSIVKELCKLLGGEVSLQSELGVGSTFTVRLPFVLPESARKDALGEPPADASARARLEMLRAETTDAVGPSRQAS